MQISKDINIAKLFAIVYHEKITESIATIENIIG